MLKEWLQKEPKLLLALISGWRHSGIERVIRPARFRITTGVYLIQINQGKGWKDRAYNAIAPGRQNLMTSHSGTGFEPMIPPIIFEDRGEVLVFMTKGLAERYLEIYDVDLHNQIFDSTGLRLKLIVSPKDKRRVEIIEPGEPRHDVELLSDILSKYILAVARHLGLPPPDVENMSLAGLIEEARKWGETE